MHHAGRFKPRARMTFATLLVVAALSAAIHPATATAVPLETLSAVLMYDNPGPGQSVLLISGRLPEGTPLPAEILLPVPADSTVLWSGEFRGDTGQENLPAEATVEERDGINVIAFTLTESLTGLAEVSYPAWRSASADTESAYDTGFDLTLPVDADQVFAAVALPMDLEVLDSSEALSISEEPDGNRYHSIRRTALTAGDEIAINMLVRRPIPAEENDRSWLLIGALAAGAIVAVGAIWFVMRRNRAS